MRLAPLNYSHLPRTSFIKRWLDGITLATVARRVHRLRFVDPNIDKGVSTHNLQLKKVEHSLNRPGDVLSPARNNAARPLKGLVGRRTIHWSAKKHIIRAECRFPRVLGSHL